MKKVISLFLSIVMLLSITAGINFNVYASFDELTYGDFEYEILEDGTAEITDYTGSASKLTIPSDFDGYSVTSIGGRAFQNCESLTNVTIPNSVTSIGDAAFDGCTSLTNITIPNSVTSIDDQAFWWCSNLISVKIPNSVTSIGNSAFYFCKSLTSVTIPNSVTSIGDSAFEYCESLTNINVALDNKNYSSQNGVLFNKNKTELIRYPMGNERISYVIPKSVTSIGDQSFSICKNLTSVTIPNSVTSIGDHTFEYCLSLTSVIIPNSVTSIGKYAFYDCISLTSVSISNSVTSIAEGAFEFCRSLTSVTIPNSVTSIGYSAFYYCESLINITIPNSVTSIGGRAFAYCKSLTDVYFTGTKEQWNKIRIEKDEEGDYEYLLNANIHYNSSNIDKCKTHKWNNGSVTKKATCKSTGVKTYTCTVCGTTKISEIAKKAHTYKTYTTKATTKKNGSVVTKCTICGAVKSKSTIYYPKTIKLSKTTYTYDGKVKKPGVTVKDSNGKTINSRNYTVTYSSGRKKIGSYKVTVKFKGNYSGTVTKTFKMAPKGTTLTSVTSNKPGQLTVKWKKQKSNTTGYKIQYATKSDFSNAKTITVNKNSTTSKTITGLSDGVKYYVRVSTYKTVNKKAVCSSWCGNKSAATKVTPTTLRSVESNPEAFTVHIKKPSKAVSGYVIQYSTDKKFKSNVKSKDISNKTVYTIKGLKSQKTYYVRVKTYKTVNGTKKYSSCSKVLSVLTRLKYPANIEVKNSSATSLKITWKKVSGAKGYEIYRSTSKNGKYKKIKTISKGTTTSYTDKNLKTTTTYYYKIVALSSKSKKANSIKSSAVGCKTKYPASSYFKAAVSNYTYTGSPIKPEPIVKNSKTGKKLRKNTDYTFSYSNNTNAGTATVIITGKGNYYGTKKVTFKIYPKPLTAEDITVSGLSNVKGVYYPATVKTRKVTLKKGTDFTFGTPTKVNDSKNSVKITFKGNYSGSVEKSYIIIQSLEEDKIELIKKTYPQNSYWGGEYHEEYLGSGCYAFAQASHKVAYGNLASKKYHNMNFDSIKVGDMVHFKNDQGTEHWVFVIAKGSDYLSVAGGNEWINGSPSVNYYNISKSKINSRIYKTDSVRR